PAYRYEHFHGVASLTPRPKYYHAVLDLPGWEPSLAMPLEENQSIRPLAAADWDLLPRIFASAFDTTQPFASLPRDTRLEAARQSLAATRDGQDGPLVTPACRVAVQNAEVVGAVLVTLLPHGDLESWEGCHWREPAPADAVERRLGWPHLTWIFVARLLAGNGVGTALLAATVAELLRLGFDQLASTFLLGNDSSLLWHWRNGFRLLSYPGSWRRFRAEVRQARATE